MIKDMLKLFITNKKALLGVIILSLFIIIALFAPLIAPYHPKQSSDQDGKFQLRAEPSSKHLLGTSHAGYDIFSRLIYGTRLSLMVGLVTGVITTFIALTLGLLGGYYGGVIDDIISFINNIFLVIPSLPLIIVIASYITIKGVWPIIFVLSFTGWAWGTRVIRSQVLTVREREFVKVAEVLGEKPLIIVFREILPNIISLVMATFFTSTIAAVIGEATLEFIGLGNISAVTWGTMLYWAQNNAALLYDAWWWFLPPGLFIGLLGTSFALMNFAIDEISNPKIRKR
ncbi:MAG: ABC transporter permease [Halanaerobium sp.]